MKSSLIRQISTTFWLLAQKENEEIQKIFCPYNVDQKIYFQDTSFVSTISQQEMPHTVSKIFRTS